MFSILPKLFSFILRYWKLFLVIGLIVLLILCSLYSRHRYNTLNKKYAELTKDYVLLENNYGNLINSNNTCEDVLSSLKRQLIKNKEDYDKKIKMFIKRIFEIKNNYASIKPDASLDECAQLKKMIGQWREIEAKHSDNSTVSSGN